MEFLYVFIGGGLGSAARYGINQVFAHTDWKFPFATLLANIIACLVLGGFMGFAMKNVGNQNLLLLGAVGFCGGLSTFSTFSLENVQLWQAGAYLTLLLNIAISVVVCFGSVLAGMRLITG